MKRGLGVLCLLGAGLAAACARPAPRAPLPDPDEYVFPAWRPGELKAAELRQFEEAWRSLLAGDLRRAERTFGELLLRKPGLTPADAAMAYARLRAGRLDEAARRFSGILERSPAYVPALVGAAASARRSGRPEDALLLYRRALAIEPDNPMLRRRTAELRVQVTERRVAAAREALARGEADQAEQGFRQALEDAQEVAGLRLELAELLVSRGDTPAAAELLQADATGDRQVLLRLAALLADLKDYPRALAAYRRVLEQNPGDEEARRLSGEIRRRYEMSRMPEEYRRIEDAASLTRADLAALISVKVTALARVSPGPTKVAVDISGSWAREHIIRALALDVLSVYPNHTFQPAATVRRGDLARAVQRVLDLLGQPPGSGPVISDLSPSSLHHYPAVRAVAAGLMDLTPEGAFQAWRPVSGREAVDVIEGVVRLVGP